MGVAGFNTTVRLAGTSTAMTDEAMSNTTGNTWQIDDTTRRVWDRTIVPTFEDNGVPINAADIASIDYLFGQVTFTGVKSGPITVSGNYLPMANIAGAHRHNINLVRVSLDDTDYQSNGNRTRITGVTDITVGLSRWEELDQTFFDAINNRTPVLIEIRPGGSGDFFRMWSVLDEEVHQGEVTEQEMQELTFMMNANSEADFGFGT